MASIQLRLLPAPQPLVERLGIGFFRAIPRVAGVYRFHDAQGRLLYVGKAADLRARLSSYRRTVNQSRKTVRLIHAAWKIEWEICSNETEARLRENDLIRRLRPRFNRAGVWPRSARYVCLQRVPGQSRFVLAAVPVEGAEVFGPFRSGVADAFAMLLRLLWMRERRTADPAALPLPLSIMARPREWILPGVEAAGTLVRDFWEGRSCSLVDEIVAKAATPGSPFAAQFWDAARTLISDFWERGPRRQFMIRSGLGLDRRILQPEEWDDLHIGARNSG